MSRVHSFISAFAHDIRDLGVVLWRNRSVQIVLFLSVLPWLVTFALHRDLNLLNSFAEIVGLVAIYWFATRRAVFRMLPVRHSSLETLVVTCVVLLWIGYRIAEYSRAVVLPAVQLGVCDEMVDTVAPKLFEMVLVPLLIFLALRYTLPQLGLGFPMRQWLPAVVPLGALIIWGLEHQRPDALAHRSFCFYLGAGFPEEFLFRGLLMSRLEVFTKRPAWAVLLSGFMFGASHLPIDIHGSGLQNWQNALEAAFTFQMGVGLALGYAFQRSRNLWPLTIIHALIDSAPLVSTALSL